MHILKKKFIKGKMVEFVRFSEVRMASLALVGLLQRNRLNSPCEHVSDDSLGSATHA